MKINRRTFILSAASIAATPWARDLIGSQVHASEQSLLFNGDMEVSDFSEYETLGGSSNMLFRSSGNSPTISNERSRAGAQSARVYLNRHTSSNTFRTEAEAVGSNRNLEFRRTYWFGFGIYVPSNWAISNTWEVVFQLHNAPLDWGSGLNFSPILGIRFKPDSDEWRLVQRYVQTAEGTHQQSDQKTAFDGLHGQVDKGAWTDWVFQYRPDWRSLADGGIGVTRIWRNGTQVIDYTGPNCVNESRGPYIKFGCYKSGWKDKDRADTDPVVERLYFYDEFRVSRPDEGSYALVAPDRSGSIAPPKPPEPLPIT